MPMSVKLDRFTWIVIVIVVALLAAAVITVSLTQGRGAGGTDYVEDGTPGAAVFNAFTALQKGDLYAARNQYSARVLEDIAEQNWDPFAGRGADTTARRLRIVEVETDPADENRALVTFVQDTYSQGGLFGGGNTWSRRGVVEVVREEGEWKINAQEFFY